MRHLPLSWCSALCILLVLLLYLTQFLENLKTSCFGVLLIFQYPYNIPLILTGGSMTVWLSAEVSRGATDTSCILQSHLPINSVDVEGTTLIAGSDNEAIYVVHQVLKKSLEDMVY